MQTVGERLRWARDQKVWTLEDLVSASGITKAAISRIENGHHEQRQSTIRKLAAALDVEPAWLMLGDDAGKSLAAA